MGYPIPKDVRAPRNFEIVRGFDLLLRSSARIADPTKPLLEGEWVKHDPAGRILKLDASDTVAAPALGARISWTLYAPGSSVLGQSDALATKQAETLSGPFEARTIYYDPAATYFPGLPLVPVFDPVNAMGYLTVLDPATATGRQLLSVVAEVLEPPTSGRLLFKSTK